jgi:spermidine/putrescine transport system ATP-binding protein
VGTPQQLYYEPATAFVASFVGANNRIFGQLKSLDGEIAEIETSDGWTVRARKSGQIAVGGHVEAFVRPEAATLERDESLLPRSQAHYVGKVRSLLFDGANSAVLLQEDLTRFEFRVALPQTGRFADLKVGERVFFSFDPQRAICFSGHGGPHA